MSTTNRFHSQVRLHFGRVASIQGRKVGELQLPHSSLSSTVRGALRSCGKPARLGMTPSGRPKICGWSWKESRCQRHPLTEFPFHQASVLHPDSELAKHLSRKDVEWVATDVRQYRYVERAPNRRPRKSYARIRSSPSSPPVSWAPRAPQHTA